MILVKHAASKNTAMVLGLTHSPVDDPGENEILTDSKIPVADDIPGMLPILFINLATKELYYNYTKQRTIEDTLKELTEQQTIIKKAMDDMIMGGS
ncbi:hypothetical protein QF049_001083 [Paenibacillus sp. W4I10]|uniref:hypothetical protein n=1 Tax=Paenibacillus sp. W4I10 TaxID=3042298 RepID=UPI00278746E7|nr:hypothetical protein [Paenibacillus sp. W4I10]MDQ0719822.1 hypothetical protein [Paenibacillus sp. W4I10]